jgi:hypothetical protein
VVRGEGSGRSGAASALRCTCCVRDSEVLHTRASLHSTDSTSLPRSSPPQPCPMRAVLQRVKSAAVHVDGACVSQIGACRPRRA